MSSWKKRITRVEYEQKVARLLEIRDEMRRRQKALSVVDSFYEFVRRAWHVIEPNEPFVDGWHIRVICDHLEAVAAGKIRNLIINVPPRHMKSSLVCVLFPAWVWIKYPGKKWLFASYAENLSKRDSIKCRLLIESEWYKTTFRIQWGLSPDQNEKMRYNNTEGGFRISTSVLGSVMGEGGDFQVVDDPHKANEVTSDTMRKAVLDWWDQGFAGRVNDPKTVAKIVVMQRLHEGDLSAHLNEKGGWVVLCLPAEWDGRKKIPTPLGWVDPRQVDGELLWEARFGRKEVEDAKRDLGVQGTAGQLQQLPAPAKGKIFMREWWKYYTALPPDIEFWAQSWDLIFDKSPKSDWVCGGVWARRGADKYLVHLIRERIGFNDQLAAFIAMTTQYPQTSAKWVEKAANGAALIDVLKRKIPGIIPITPLGSKKLRAESVAPEVQAGNIYLPTNAAWVPLFVEEHAVFDNGVHDDQVDMMSQAVSQLTSGMTYDCSPISITQASKWR